MLALSILDRAARLAAGTFTTFLLLVTSHAAASAAADSVGYWGGSLADTGKPVTVEPLSGPVGTKVTVGGKGFSANTPITVRFDGNATDAPSVSTGVSGDFNLAFFVPASSSGDHTIEVSDGTNVGSHSFVVTPAATIDSQTGYAGMQVSITGSGFLANGTANISFDNTSVQKAPIAPDGSFSAVFDVPARIAGTYTVRITDGNSTRELVFAVTTSASMNPVTNPSAPGFVGQKVTIGGVGFVPGRTLSINYDGKQVAEGTVGPDSNFSVTFGAPASRGGQHTVTVSDGVNIIPLKFYMESNPPPTPTLIVPAAGTTQKARAKLEWSAVSDPSGVAYKIQIATSPNFDSGSVVLDKAGITATEYELSDEEKLKPVKRTNPYFWRVGTQDGAFNASTWSNTNYFTVGAPTPAWVTWMFVGLGAVIVVLFGFWLGRRTSSRPPAKPGAGAEPK